MNAHTRRGFLARLGALALAPIILAADSALPAKALMREESFADYVKRAKRAEELQTALLARLDSRVQVAVSLDRLPSCIVVRLIERFDQFGWGKLVSLSYLYNSAWECIIPPEESIAQAWVEGRARAIELRLQGKGKMI